MLKAGDGEAIPTRELYQARAPAENGIASVQKNCAQDERYERKEASNGNFHFDLKAANYRIIGSSQMDATARSRDSGIASVKADGASTTVKDLTES